MLESVVNIKNKNAHGNQPVLSEVIKNYNNQGNFLFRNIKAWEEIPHPAGYMTLNSSYELSKSPVTSPFT